MVEKGLAKRNCCSGSLETGWLLRPVFWGDLVLWPQGTVTFPLTQWGHLDSGSCHTSERREQDLKGELVASTVGIF